MAVAQSFNYTFDVPRPGVGESGNWEIGTATATETGRLPAATRPATVLAWLGLARLLRLFGLGNWLLRFCWLQPVAVVVAAAAAVFRICLATKIYHLEQTKRTQAQQQQQINIDGCPKS